MNHNILTSQLLNIHRLCSCHVNKSKRNDAKHANYLVSNVNVLSWFHFHAGVVFVFVKLVKGDQHMRNAQYASSWLVRHGHPCVVYRGQQRPSTRGFLTNSRGRSQSAAFTHLSTRRCLSADRHETATRTQCLCLPCHWSGNC